MSWADTDGLDRDWAGRAGPDHRLFTWWAAPRPGPVYHILKKSWPGPARDISSEARETWALHWKDHPKHTWAGPSI